MRTDDAGLERDDRGDLTAEPHLAVALHDEPQLLDAGVTHRDRHPARRELEVGHAAPLAPNEHPHLGAVGGDDVEVGGQGDGHRWHAVIMAAGARR